MQFDLGVGVWSPLRRPTGALTLNALLDAEADYLCNAGRYERTPQRVDTRAGHYMPKLQTKAGEVTLKMPRLRSLTFETHIIERYRRRESSTEETLIEMYLAGVSVLRVEDITEALTFGSQPREVKALVVISHFGANIRIRHRPPARR